MTLTSQYEGTCKLCGKEWKVGDQIHYSKTPKAICTDEACFNKQKAGEGQTTLTPPAGSPPVKIRTESEKTEDSKHQVEILWTIADTKASSIIDEKYKQFELSGKEVIKEKMILAEVLYKGLSLGWSLP